MTSVLQGEYGVSDVSLSVPSIIGVNGIDRRLEERWSEFEYERFVESAENIKGFWRDYNENILRTISNKNIVLTTPK